MTSAAPLRWQAACVLVLPAAALGVLAGWTHHPLAVGLALAGGTLAGAWVAGGVSRRIHRAALTARQLASGDFTVSVNVVGSPECRGLASGLDGIGRANALREDQLNRALDDAANQRDLFYSIINASSDGLLLYDKDRQLLAANLRCAELLGFSIHDLLTRPRQALQRAIAARSSEPEQYEARLEAHFERPDQPHQDLLVIREPRRLVLRRYSCPVITQRGVQGRVFTYTDITVESEVDRMKSEFVSMASHELRTPLTSVHGALQLVLTGSGGRLTAEDRELLEISLSSTERLVRMVNDLLDLSKIEAGRMPLVLAPLDVAGLLEQAARGMQGFAATRETRITVTARDAAARVSGDRDHLLRVLTNLLSNALKYSPAGSTVLLSSRVVHEGIEFSVQDAGPGIPPDHVDRLFRPFSRLGAHERQMTGGTGLGLAISRAIVEQHKGRIWVERVQPSGCRFAFVVPAGASDRAPDEGGEAVA
jgi:signal transduction histidine kinase